MDGECRQNTNCLTHIGIALHQSYKRHALRSCCICVHCCALVSTVARRLGCLSCQCSSAIVLVSSWQQLQACCCRVNDVAEARRILEWRTSHSFHYAPGGARQFAEARNTTHKDRADTVTSASIRCSPSTVCTCRIRQNRKSFRHQLQHKRNRSYRWPHHLSLILVVHLYNSERKLIAYIYSMSISATTHTLPKLCDAPLMPLVCNSRWLLIVRRLASSLVIVHAAERQQRRR